MKRLVLAGIVILSAAAGGATVAAPADPAQASYDMAFGLTRAGSFGLAESAWRSFLSKYPDHPLAGNAQYFLGETFYDRRDFARAAIAFGVGAEKYPKSEMAAPTLLKLGIALGRSGETAQACDAFARLHRQFPELGGVIRERALVEARQYRCAEAAAAPPAGAAPSAPAVKLAAAPAAHDTAPLPPAPPSVIAAPAPVAPATPAAAAPPGTSVPDRSGEPLKAAEAEPAPPAQPVPPVDRAPLAGVDAERAAAKAELVPTPPPVVKPRLAALTRPAASPRQAGADEIKAAQTLLAALDYDPGPIDGQNGAKLREAVRAFEKRNDMRPDGEVSDRLLQRLSAAVAARKAPAPAATTAAQRLAGTGFVVSKSGFVVTSYRLVAACKEVRVRSVASESVPAPVIAADQRDDLALLRFKSAAAAAVSFRDGRGPRQGEGVVVTGLSLGEGGSSDFYLTTGVINALSGGHDDNRLLRISAPIDAESGGAPVFDGHGHVIGILGAAGRGRGKGGDGTGEAGLALRATVARNFLDAHNVDYDSAAAGAELKAAEIGDAAKDVVVLVECHR